MTLYFSIRLKLVVSKVSNYWIQKSHLLYHTHHISLQSCSGLGPSWQTLDCTPSFSENWTVRVKVALLTVGVLLINEISGRITTGEKGNNCHLQIILA